MKYKHLNLEERYYIAVESKSGRSANQIAKVLGRSQSSISRELKRNKGQKGYRYKQANILAHMRHESKPKKIKLNDTIKLLINYYLSKDLSPEQIAGRLNYLGVISLHHETIYKYILSDKRNGGSLYKLLRHKNKRYRKRYGNSNNRTGIPNRVDIDMRPEVANNRERVGDIEADTIIGKNHKGAIVTLDDRKTKLRLAMVVKGKKSELVQKAITTLLQPIKSLIQTITFDNGKEFAQHEIIAENLECETYFCKPYHSWERGQNENANGLLRQYFPKSMELLDVSQKKVLEAVHKLNCRPRKCLGYKTPCEAFIEATGVNIEILKGYALMT